jgi:serine protease AprX
MAAPSLPTAGGAFPTEGEGFVVGPALSLRVRYRLASSGFMPVEGIKVKHVERSFAATFVSLLSLLALAGALAPGGPGRAGIRLARAGGDAARRQEETADRVSPDLLEIARDPDAQGRRVRVILQTDDEAGASLKALLRRRDVRTRGELPGVGARVVELPARLVERLSAREGVRFVSPDRETISFGHVSLTTGTDDARSAAADTARNAGPNGPNGQALDGTGIGIAVLDSGVDTGHVAFRDERGGGLRVVRSVDFTGENRTDDPYGHGTHVASIAAGNGRIAHGAYIGIAPNASLINLRVLGAQGTGRVSSILAALDWVIQNRSAYNIRVVNMSLGTAAVESYKNDPVCRAVRKAVDAGVVVVAAAGNLGKDSAGNKLYGLIHSPGDEPSAITVGATNTFGTDARSDDGVTTYSSRGPTRGYTTDALGVKHYDNLVKPDLVAPGNKIIDAAAEDNYLITTYPSLDARVSEDDRRREMYLNGTSMATPVVAGMAALMLQANPRLTPNLVKMILMYTAQPLAGFNQLEQGAGELNVEGAVRVAKLVRTDLSSATPLGAPLLTTTPAPLPQTTIAGYTFVWSQGMVLKYGYATGSSLITSYQKIYGLGVLVTDGVTLSDGVLVTDRTMLSDGVLVTDSVTLSDGGALGGGPVYLGAGVLVTDQTFAGDGVLVTDNTLGADSFVQAMSATAEGDTTASMSPAREAGDGPLNAEAERAEPTADATKEDERPPRPYVSRLRPIKE